MSIKKKSNTTLKHTNSAKQIVYQEKYYVPSWWYLAALLAIYPIYYTIKLRFNSQNDNLFIFLILVLLAYWLLLFTGRKKLILYSNGVLKTDNAAIEVKYFAKLLVITKDMKKNAMGTQLDPNAYINHHFWIRTMLLCTLDDINDPTPYWLLSTRKPLELKERIEELERNHLF